ncbi:Fic family protein [Bifidobacterium dentium]|uniref:Fic family protein n=1 Tax=Bifidobacterium dentium TaxID=1689 RepID=UPI0018B03819|nr:Fic family protein [Bifidobacterium dentium]MBF9690487.1 Fic family protein [Bifidobacterium dentium]MBF9694408.1 Fic family protein [Bifidobacterium dentium]
MIREDGYYVSTGEGTPETRSGAWSIGFGLQAADGLSPSGYAVEQSREQISGRASYAEVEHRLRAYHSENGDEAEHFEADIVSTRISSLLQTRSFVFAPPMLRQIHRHLFDGVLEDDWVGRWRHVNLTKPEPVLRGDSVAYAPFHLIGEMLDYDFGQERRRQADYPKAGRRDIAASAFGFVSGLWQIHPFREGNTRTTAVFAIMYLGQLGFAVGNEPFARNARYFRDALALDNTFDPDFKDPEPLRRFMERTLFDPSVRLEDLRSGHSANIQPDHDGSPVVGFDPESGPGAHSAGIR